MQEKPEKIRVGFAVSGSFCTFAKAFEQAKSLVASGYDLTPIMSFSAAQIDTRFGKAAEHIEFLESLCGKSVIKTIAGAEPVGPKKMFDILVVAPCTSNTLAKLALGITDTPVTMAVKSHIRNMRPVVIAPSTNDALSASSKNIGILRNYKNFYFVPIYQDDCENKPNSMIPAFEMLPKTIELALSGKQIQPIIMCK